MLDSKKAVEFLVFSCIGATTNQDEQTILSKAVFRAYRDAASHVLSVKDEHKESLKQDGKKLIVSFLRELNNGKIINYNDAHKELCNNIFNIYSNEDIYKADKTGKFRKMSIGIAQKWINMSVKYVYVLKSTCFESTDFFENHFDEYSDNFHIPLDSIMIEKIKTDLGIDSEEYDITTWSSIDKYNKYIEYQTAIKELFKNEAQAPIDWENKVWIEH